MSKILVTKTFLPPIEEYQSVLEEIWSTGWITNNGKYAQELEQQLKDYLGVKHLLFINNGTIALQFAIQALELTGEIITTPFSFIATTSSIVWEKCEPIFADINKETWCIDPCEIEKKITENTSAILATNVFGNNCDFETIQEIADRYNLKVIYDSAHSFGVKVNNQSVLNFGDISTLSFHATKVFHTVEGGAIVTNNDALAEKIKLMRNFGLTGPTSFGPIGVNGKNSEFHAAMGVINLKYYESNTAARKIVWDIYYNTLDSKFKKLSLPVNNFQYNYAYFPIVFETEKQLLEAQTKLEQLDIYPRRYFNPSLNTVHYVSQQKCSISEQIAKTVLCLPLYHDLEHDIVREIVSIINNINS